MMTSQQLLNILPIKDELRRELRESWETMNPDERFEVESALWDAYYDLYQLKLEKNIQKKMDAIYNKQDKLSPDFYKEVQEETEKELQSEQVSTGDTTELADVRDKLQKLMDLHARAN